MTKAKIANGNCLNPVGRLEKRFDEYKRCHEIASSNCNKMQESHNKNSDALKALLEKKSKLSDNKIKKKRSAIATTINRKKSKPNQELAESLNKCFDNTVEITPNVTLNIHTSEIPDIDWDNLDILNCDDFSRPINEQELDGVLNTCYSQSYPMPDIKPSQHSPTISKTSPNVKIDDLFSRNSATNFKSDEPIYPPLFPSPERSNVVLYPQEPVKFEYVTPTNCNYNQITSANQQMRLFNPQTNMYPNNNLSYQYHNPSITDQIPANSNQYFYQCPTYVTEQAVNSADNFQLPVLANGWYNNGSVQTEKPLNFKPSLTHHQQFVNNSVPVANYRQNYTQYQTNPSQIHYQQMFSNTNLANSQSYDQTRATTANYTMNIQEQQPPAQYYYVNYANNGTVPSNSRTIIDQNDSHFLLSNHQTNPAMFRNIYQ